MSRVHLHRDDSPVALGLMTQLAEGRHGFEATEVGAFVDWDEVGGTLSTTEEAIAHIARGIAMIEHHGGGVPSRFRDSLAQAFEVLIGRQCPHQVYGWCEKCRGEPF